MHRMKTYNLDIFLCEKILKDPFSGSSGYQAGGGNISPLLRAGRPGEQQLGGWMLLLPIDLEMFVSNIKFCRFVA